MAKKQTELTSELRDAIADAARAGALEAYGASTGTYVNYFKAMETLLFNYKKIEALVADEEGYCEVEYHAGKKTFSASPSAKGYYEQKSEADIVEEMQEEKRRRFNETKYGFIKLQKTVKLFENKKEFVVIRLYYFGETVAGEQRQQDKAATWEDVTAELSAAGILKEGKTARRWRNKIVNDMAVCLFGVAAAVSAGTYHMKPLDK